jgi:membrane protease YdiL (CAAX protease family)
MDHRAALYWAISLDSAAYVSVLIFIMWSSGDPWSEFGIRRPFLLRDIPLGIVLAGALSMSTVVSMAWLSHTPLSEFRPAAYSTWQYVFRGQASIAVAYVLAGTFGNVMTELLYRGLLIPRFSELTGRAWIGVLISSLLAVLVSPLIFSMLYQLTQGTSIPHVYYLEEAVWLGLRVGYALVLGFVFVRTRSIWPGIFAGVASTILFTVGFW